MAKRSGSEIAAVLFDRDYFAPSEAKAWVKKNIPGRQKAPREMHSEGGSVLKKGDYIKIPVGPERKFSSYGYKDSGSDGIYFQIGGHRGRSKRGSQRARDHLGAGGEYYVIYESPYSKEGVDKADGPYTNLKRAVGVANTLQADGAKVLEIMEYDPVTTRNKTVKTYASEKRGSQRARDHLGAGGEYYVGYDLGGVDEGHIEGPFESIRGAKKTAANLKATGAKHVEIYELDPNSEKIILVS
jgi:hypothetical protein